jgi:hypothetical protein
MVFQATIFALIFFIGCLFNKKGNRKKKKEFIRLLSSQKRLPKNDAEF